MLLGGLDRSRDRKNDKPSRDKNDMPDRDKMNDMPLAAISRHQSRRSGGHPQGYYDTVASS
jgi:hypothetical protein